MPPVFPCFQAFANWGCADVQSVLWHATAAPAIVNPADNRKEMFIKVSEPVHPGLHLPSAACGVKNGCLIFSSLFLSGRPSLCSYTLPISAVDGYRICSHSPSDRRLADAGKCLKTL